MIVTHLSFDHRHCDFLWFLAIVNTGFTRSLGDESWHFCVSSSVSHRWVSKRGVSIARVSARLCVFPLTVAVREDYWWSLKIFISSVNKQIEQIREKGIVHPHVSLSVQQALQKDGAVLLHWWILSCF